ncbi:MAG: HIT domain-containing protein [Solirubrobacterales bacterium]|nr:HIT domain-containing protein [Solirubrobacterales bacterium]MBV8943432.1 HIT domain-containing protein [Solirubrobacterales bacterium]MBV9164832.1 HIT domain-containing protein [Solirubrobacterales bacterium]MBV9533810.1 HIT domain-containing protein [Solirubrobacterales bacterium]
MPERQLWAPWRLEYVVSDKEAECIFCSAAHGHEQQAKWIVDRGERCFTILNTFPYAPGHVMVAPSRHVGELEELDGDEMAELLVLARRGVTALRRAMSAHGFNVGLNLGEVAGAGIADHLHLHVVPRWQGDNNFMPVLGDTRVMNQALEAAKAALVDGLSAVA